MVDWGAVSWAVGLVVFIQVIALPIVRYDINRVRYTTHRRIKQ